MIGAVRRGQTVAVHRFFGRSGVPLSRSFIKKWHAFASPIGITEKAVAGRYEHVSPKELPAPTKLDVIAMGAFVDIASNVPLFCVWEFADHEVVCGSSRDAPYQVRHSKFSFRRPCGRGEISSGEI